MATLVLAAAAPEVGFFTKFALSLAAAYIDSALIYPALFPQPEVKGQRLTGFEFQHAEEGAPANRLFGKEMRCAGTVIWASPLREVEDRNRASKGGRGNEAIKYKHYRDVAIEICRLKRGKEIKNVKKVLADGRPFYDPRGVGISTSNKISVTLGYRFFGEADLFFYHARIISDESAGGPDLTIFQGGEPVTISGFTSAHPLSPAPKIEVETTGASSLSNGIGDQYAYIAVTDSGILSRNDTVVFAGIGTVYTVMAVIPGTVSLVDNDGYTFHWQAYPYMEFSGTALNPQFAYIRLNTTLSANLADGQDVTPTSGATANGTTAAPGTWRCTGVGRTAAGMSYMQIEASDVTTMPFCAKSNSIDTITVTQEDRTFPEAIADDVRFYTGSRSQGQDPTIVAIEGPNVGAANVPAYRGRAVLVVENLELSDFANRIPNFEFIVEIDDDDSVQYAMGEMLQDAGVPPDAYDLSGVPTSLKLGGYVMRGVQNTKSAFQPLTLAFHLLSQQTEKLRLFQRTSATLLDLTDKTVAYVPGSPAPRPGRFRQAGDTRVPTRVEVKYFDPVNGYEVAVQRSKNPLQSGVVSPFDTNMAMTTTQALTLASTLYELTRTSGRQSIVITLPPSYLGIIKESMRFKLSKFGQVFEFLIIRVDIGANWVIECEAVQDDLEPFTQSVVAEGTLGL